MRRWQLAATLLALSGCATQAEHEHNPTCRADEQVFARDVLYFGSAMRSGGQVDDDSWRQFEDEILAPAFAQGYTVIDAQGIWRAPAGDITKEASRVVVILHADTSVAGNALRDVVARYRDRFHQESVLQEHNLVCVRF